MKIGDRVKIDLSKSGNSQIGNDIKEGVVIKVYKEGFDMTRPDGGISINIPYNYVIEIAEKIGPGAYRII